MNDPEWYLIACSREPVDANIFRHGGINVFRLYLYPSPEEGKHTQARLGVELTGWPAGKDGRRPNLNPEFVADFEKRLGLKFVPEGAAVAANYVRRETDQDRRSQIAATEAFGPEDVFKYIYAAFHSPTYRTRYAEFLKSDFPRVPLTSDVNIFRSLCGLGAELVALHLLESPKLKKPIARYPVTGSNLVEKGFPKYLAPGDPALPDQRLLAPNPALRDRHPCLELCTVLFPRRPALRDPPGLNDSAEVLTFCLVHYPASTIAVGGFEIGLETPPGKSYTNSASDIRFCEAG